MKYSVEIKYYNPINIDTKSEKYWFLNILRDVDKKLKNDNIIGSWIYIDVG